MSSCMMSGEVCLRWQESQHSACRVVSQKTGFKERGGLLRQADEKPFILPSSVRLVNAAGRLARQRINHIKLLHIFHFSSHLISSSQPLVATSLCNHAKQARGKIAIACTNQDSKRVKHHLERPWSRQHVLPPFRMGLTLHRHPMRRQ